MIKNTDLPAEKKFRRFLLKPAPPMPYRVPTSNTSTRMTRTERIKTDFFLLRRKKDYQFGELAEILHPNSAKQNNLYQQIGFYKVSYPLYNINPQKIRLISVIRVQKNKFKMWVHGRIMRGMARITRMSSYCLVY
jgi:hypothetical protein